MDRDRWGWWDDPDGGSWYEPDGSQIGIDSGEDEMDDAGNAHDGSLSKSQVRRQTIQEAAAEERAQEIAGGGFLGEGPDAETRRLIEAGITPSTARMIEAGIPPSGIFGDDRERPYTLGGPMGALKVDDEGGVIGRVPRPQVPMIVRALKVTSKYLQNGGDIVVTFERVDQAQREDSTITFETAEEREFAQSLALGSTITITVQAANIYPGSFRT